LGARSIQNWAHPADDRAIMVLDQGRVIHIGKASDLQAQPELLDGLLGIAVTKD
jgi:ABC-type branched-subunit amino acid transport system ATPase component